MDFATVQMYYSTNNIKAKADAGLILAAGTVGFIKTLEHIGQILRRDARTGIANGHQRTRTIAVVLYLNIPAFVNELHGVFNRIINYLSASNRDRR